MQKKHVRISIDISKEMHTEFKLKCVKEGKKLKEFILELVRLGYKATNGSK